MKNLTKALFAMAAITFITGASNAQADRRITDIRAKAAAIDSAAAKYKKTKKDVFGISTEGAEATLYHSGKELKKVVAKIYGETFNGTSEFYFSGGKLIFEYDRINHYDTQIGLKKPVKVVRIEQIRSYFDDGKLFRLVNGTKTVDSKSEEFANAEKGANETIKAIFDAETGK